MRVVAVPPVPEGGKCLPQAMGHLAYAAVRALRGGGGTGQEIAAFSSVTFFSTMRLNS